MRQTPIGICIEVIIKLYSVTEDSFHAAMDLFSITLILVRIIITSFNINT